jgi:hypothetical protein
MGTPAAERMRQMRQRRAEEQRAALEPVEGPCPLADEDRLVPAVEATVAALGLAPEFAAAAQLARRYAALADQAADPARALVAFGPAFLRVLVALEATPAARPAARPRPGRSRPNRVEQLRAEHARRMAGRGTGA